MEAAGGAADKRSAALAAGAKGCELKARRLSGEASRLASEAGRRREGPAWARLAPGNVLWRAASGRFWWLLWEEAPADLDRKAEARRKAAAAARRRGAAMEAEGRRYAAISARLAAEASGLPSLPPMEAGLRRKASAAASAAIAGESRAEAFRAKARTLVSVARIWRKEARTAAIASPAVPASAKRPGPLVAMPERVYLPIPFGMGAYAKAAGARYDHDVQRGSRWYVPPGEPLAKFEEFLPLAYRKAPPKLSFPPVRHGASSQNLWSLFDKGTWNRIRQINYERTGRRCMLCGKQSGNLLRYLDPEGERKLGTVECHEIWEWQVPDPDVSIGIQRLREIVVACFECHAAFHNSWARSAARSAGVEDEVTRFLMKRRAFLTRLDPVSVARDMKREADRLREHSGVGLWILDLAHLGQQDYMRQVSPVFVENNVPGVRPRQIAGLQFVTDGGQSFAATSAGEAHASLADLYSLNPLRRLQLPRTQITESLSVRR